MSLFDSIREALPPILGGTGGALTSSHKAALTQAEIDSAQAVATRADQYYGSDSEAAAAAHAAADEVQRLAQGDVDAVAADNDKRNSACSLLSVINQQAQFSVCYPNAKWYIGGAIALLILYVLSPYVKLAERGQ